MSGAAGRVTTSVAKKQDECSMARAEHERSSAYGYKIYPIYVHTNQMAKFECSSLLLGLEFTSHFIHTTVAHALLA